jgi:hypothetical protein
MVKFSPTEAAEIISAVEKNSSFSAYHRSEKQVTQITFEPYWKKQKQDDGSWAQVGEQLGFSYRIAKQAKDDSTNKTNIAVGLTWGEAKLLSMYLEEALKFTFDYRERDYKPQDFKKNNDAPAETKLKEKVAKKVTVPDDDEDLEW